jgi:hypothetical protein
MKMARGVRYRASKLGPDEITLDQIPCDLDYPADSDERWNRE